MNAFSSRGQCGALQATLGAGDEKPQVPGGDRSAKRTATNVGRGRTPPRASWPTMVNTPPRSRWGHSLFDRGVGRYGPRYHASRGTDDRPERAEREPGADG